MKSILTILSFLLTTYVFANNIQLQKVSLSDTNRTTRTVNIKMNISWEHSWRDSINWDAAWIIIKYKEPKDNAWKWKHAQLSLIGNNTGTASGVKIVVPDDRTGAFFYRSEIGSGTVASDNVKLLWNYGATGVTNIDSVEVRVFATEMIYVPQGNYCLGDGNGSARSPYSFQLKKAPNNYAVINDKWSPLIITGGSYPASVGDDRVLNDDGIRLSGTNGLDVNDDKVADYPDYPTGYKGFYCMKYKVTQGQYADFLNSIYAEDTAVSVIDNYVAIYSSKLQSVPKQLKAVWHSLTGFLYSPLADYPRNTIALDTLQMQFIVSRPDRACDLMDLNRSLAFSEWSGLRPMSELEYEKACRGPLPAFYNNYKGEMAWGNDAGYPVSSMGSLTYSGIENGTEYFRDYDITKRNLMPNYFSMTTTTVGGDGGYGPYRVGIYATENSSRISSGASYYGIMDFNKITNEIVIPVSNSVLRTLSYSSYGKGMLTALGKNYTFAKFDGANLGALFKVSAVSERGAKWFSTGFRAVRLAPSDN